jgi:hypothetical protein
MPGLRVTSIQLPWGAGEPAIVQGQWQAWLVRERTNALFLDPATGRVLGIRAAHRMGPGERWVHSADPLHFGNFAGVASKLVWVVFGLMLTGLCLSGAVIHARRLAAAAARGAPGGAPGLFDGLGPAKWPSLALVTLVPAWFFLNGWDGGTGAPREPVATVQLEGASWRLWRAPLPEGAERWCAEPLAGADGRDQPVLARQGTTVTAVFDAGLFCAELPGAPGPPRLRLR